VNGKEQRKQKIVKEAFTIFSKCAIKAKVGSLQELKGKW
jgi:hypothetical protein